MLLRKREQGERWLALLELVAELDRGTSPEALSPEPIGKLLAVQGDSADTVVAHAIAYSAAFHRREDAQAAEMLETCLRHLGRAPSTLRDAVMCDAATFQAKRRKRVDLAEQWLAELPNPTRPQWMRTQSVAAILEARGDVSGALAKIAECEKEILSSTEERQQKILLPPLQRWTSELRDLPNADTPAAPAGCVEPVKSELDLCTEPERVRRCVRDFERGTRGGLEEYYRDGSSDSAYLVVDALTAVGARTTARIALEANGLFDGGQPPRDAVTRRRALERMSWIASSTLGRLGVELERHGEDLTALLRDYLRKHDVSAGSGSQGAVDRLR